MTFHIGLTDADLIVTAADISFLSLKKLVKNKYREEQFSAGRTDNSLLSNCFLDYQIRLERERERERHDRVRPINRLFLTARSRGRYSWR